MTTSMRHTIVRAAFGTALMVATAFLSVVLFSWLLGFHPLVSILVAGPVAGYVSARHVMWHQRLDRIEREETAEVSRG